MPTPHKSSSKLQGEVELKMMKTLGDELGKPLDKKRIEYHGAAMEIDGVDAEETVFVEAFARLDAFKSGQRRKIATDVLKFVVLRPGRPDARFILAFADEVAKDSVVGWLRTVTEQHRIELAVIDLPRQVKEELAGARLDQKSGMETGGDATD